MSYLTGCENTSCGKYIGSPALSGAQYIICQDCNKKGKKPMTNDLKLEVGKKYKKTDGDIYIFVGNKSDFGYSHTHPYIFIAPDGVVHGYESWFLDTLKEHRESVEREIELYFNYNPNSIPVNHWINFLVGHCVSSTDVDYKNILKAAKDSLNYKKIGKLTGKVTVELDQ